MKSLKFNIWLSSVRRFAETQGYDLDELPDYDFSFEYEAGFTPEQAFKHMKMQNQSWF